MSKLTTNQGVHDTGKAVSVPQRSHVPWPKFIENLVSKYGAHMDMPVVDRLPSQKEAELDRYLAAGIDINNACFNDGSYTLPPLFLAISNPCLPLVNALLERGASVSMRTVGMLGAGSSSPVSIKRSALTLSLIEGSQKSPHAQAITRALLSTPAVLAPEEINATDDCLLTPLAHSVFRRHALARDTLVAAGADPLVRDMDGQTLLHVLASNQAEKAATIEEEAAWVQWAIDHGVPVDAIDADGNTARSLARERRGPDDGFLGLLEGALAHHQAAHLDRNTQPAPVPSPSRLRRI